METINEIKLTDIRYVYDYLLNDYLFNETTGYTKSKKELLQEAKNLILDNYKNQKLKELIKKSKEYRKREFEKYKNDPVFQYCKAIGHMANPYWLSMEEVQGLYWEQTKLTIKEQKVLYAFKFEEIIEFFTNILNSFELKTTIGINEVCFDIVFNEKTKEIHFTHYAPIVAQEFWVLKNFLKKYTKDYLFIFTVSKPAISEYHFPIYEIVTGYNTSFRFMFYNLASENFIEKLETELNKTNNQEFKKEIIQFLKNYTLTLKKDINNILKNIEIINDEWYKNE